MLYLLLSCSNSSKPQYCSDPLGFEMVVINKGSFLMGSETEEVDTRPIHKVNISQDFCLLSTEVTQKMWSRSTLHNSSPFQSPQRPISNITWFETLEFANQMSLLAHFTPCYEIPSEVLAKSIDIANFNKEIPWKKDCTGYRLPTEAEWEYAARNDEKWNYSGGYIFDRYAVYKENSQQETKPIKSMLSNNWGLYDMSGNVAEWVWDGYGAYPTGPLTDPKGSQNPRSRVSRGGGFPDSPNSIRVDVRSADGPEWRFDWVGMRLARNKP